MYEVIIIRENPAIEAVQFTEIEKNRVFRWIKCNCYADFNSYGEPILKIDSPKGVLTANLGDYIIREEGGLYYPVPPQEFNVIMKRLATDMAFHAGPLGADDNGEQY